MPLNVREWTCRKCGTVHDRDVNAGPKGAPWSGVVRIECPADLPVAEVTRLAGLSQRCLGKFASSPYKDSRVPAEPVPDRGPGT